MMVVKGTTNCVMLVKPPYTRRGSLAQVSCQIVWLVTVLCCTVLYCTVLYSVQCTVLYLADRVVGHGVHHQLHVEQVPAVATWSGSQGVK